MMLSQLSTAYFSALQQYQKALEQRVRDEAKLVRQYISAPETTPFAVLYLATEGLYAQILGSRSGLAEKLQQQGILLAGPTTVTALLNALAMGFRTLAINRKATEVWQVLGAAKMQYEKFGDLLQKARKKVDEAGKDIEFGDAKDFREIYDIVMNNPTVQQKLTEWAKKFPRATYGSDPSNPLYEYGFADINATLSASSSKNIYYASQLLDELDVINLPAGDPNRWEKGDTSYVAVATGEINGKKYMVALFKTSIQKNPDYNPNQGKN